MLIGISEQLLVEKALDRRKLTGSFHEKHLTNATKENIFYSVNFCSNFLNKVTTKNTKQVTSQNL